MFNQKVDTTAVLNLLNRNPIEPQMPVRANEPMLHPTDAAKRITQMEVPR